MLTEKELFVRNFMGNTFIPNLHATLKEANPKKYEEWDGNTHHQSAIFGAYILKILLSEYEWSVWEGTFENIVLNKKVICDHAWIYGVDEINHKRLFVDLSINHHERLFIEVANNAYLNHHPIYENMKEIQRNKISYKEKLKEIEYYTQKPSYVVLQELLKKCDLIR